MVQGPDWDKLVEDADDSPRGILAELLAKADDLDKVAVVYMYKDGTLAQCSSIMTTLDVYAMYSYAAWYEANCMSRSGD